MYSLIQTRNTITLELARRCLDATLHKANELNVKVSIAVVNEGGNLISMAHMDGAPLQSREIALNKALTAVGFGLSTNLWSERLDGCSSAVRQGLPLQTAMALFGGGEPLRMNDQIIGAVGVSGASEAVDGECALAAVKKVTELLVSIQR